MRFCRLLLPFLLMVFPPAHAVENVTIASPAEAPAPGENTAESESGAASSSPVVVTAADQILLSSQASATAPAPTPAARFEHYWEPDFYYTSIGTQIRLDNSPVPDGGGMPEHEVYRRLLLDSLSPRLLLIEASVYPAPIVGTYLKKHQASFYDDMVIARADGTELNIIDSVTAGFQEPWAISAFLGSEMTFTRAGDQKRKTNAGYMGYLISVGKKHIRNNVLIDDTWTEFEWKLKGEREFREDSLSWSFRAGYKHHDNAWIRDVVYLGFRRSSLDFNRPLLAFIANSNIDIKTEFARDGMGFLRQEIVLGKKLPIKRWRIAPSLEFGLILEKDDKYSGPLSDPTIDELTFVFRPNIDW